MGQIKGAILCGLIVALACSLPLSITSVVLGIDKPGNCDITDRMGLDVGQWLIGSGIAGIFLAISTAFFISCILFDCCPGFASFAMIILCVISILFGFAWFIVGAIILFRGNIECIRMVSTHVIYALVLWCISALNLLLDCQRSRSNQAD